MSHSYLWPALLASLPAPPGRLIDLGCGGGMTAGMLAERGWNVVGVDPSQDAIDNASSSFPKCWFEVGSAYDDLSRLGQFEVVVSLEVVERLPDPRRWAWTIHGLLKPGGVAVVSAAYHGYAKNLAMALVGKWESHHPPLNHFGNFRFWSRATLARLLTESGLRVTGFRGAGGCSLFWKSMVLTAVHPA